MTKLNISSVGLIISIIFLGIAAACNTAEKTSTYPQIIFPDKRIINLIDIADTNAKRTQGLSERSSLGGDEGMWFVFENEGYHPFWMKDMNFSVDIIWANEDYRVTDIVRNVPIPLEDVGLPTYNNTQSARYVLEVNAGVSEGLFVGDVLKMRSAI